MSESEIGSVTFLLEGADRQLETEVGRSFPEAIISPADNFLGGLEIAVILKPAKDILESILRFVNDWRDRYKDASVSINGKKIDIKGYGPDDAMKILAQVQSASAGAKGRVGGG